MDYLIYLFSLFWHICLLWLHHTIFLSGKNRSGYLKINNHQPYLRKSTQNDSVRRYPILHFLFDHGFDCKETREKQFSLLEFPQENQIDYHRAKVNAFPIVAGYNVQSGNKVSSRTVLWCSFNTGFIFNCSRAQTMDIKPVRVGKAVRLNGTITTNLKVALRLTTKAWTFSCSM